MVSVLQLYVVSWLCSNMESVGCAAIWCHLVLQLYGVSWLCRYMVSIGCADIWCGFVVQLLGGIC